MQQIKDDGNHGRMEFILRLVSMLRHQKSRGEVWVDAGGLGLEKY